MNFKQLVRFGFYEKLDGVYELHRLKSNGTHIKTEMSSHDYFDVVQEFVELTGNEEQRKQYREAMELYDYETERVKEIERTAIELEIFQPGEVPVFSEDEQTIQSQELATV